MRRLLTLATIGAALAAGSVGVAAASGYGSGFGSGGHDGARHGMAARAPIRLPHGLPHAAAGQPNAFTFTSVDGIAASLAPGRPATSTPRPGPGASASVTVTATVLPVALVVVDSAGAAQSVTINTDDRDGRHLLFAVRRGSLDGAPVAITGPSWGSIAGALRATRAGTGTVWSR